jgi:FlaA1/EpsC-like NDP-sugar epimerase
MDKTLTVFFTKVQDVIFMGEKKYQDLFMKEDSQLPYIMEKVYRIKSGTSDPTKNLEDLTKIAAYAYLEWVRRGVCR